MAGGKASAKKIELAERRRLAVTLRKQGGTFRQIAEQLRKVDGVSENYSQSDAYKDVIHELRRLEEEQAEDVLTLRRLELERLDEMWSALWGPFKKGDYAAFDRLVTVMNQRGRYLPVFDQSDKTTNLNLAVTQSSTLSDDDRVNLILALIAKHRTGVESDLPEQVSEQRYNGVEGQQGQQPPENIEGRQD